MRKAKREYLAADSAGLSTSDESMRLAETRRRLADVLKQTGGSSEATRTGISGFGRSEASKAVWENRYRVFIRDDASQKTASGLPSKLIGLPDEKIPQTAEVAFDNLHGVVPKGADATKVYVMAGKGTSTPIHDLRRLYALHPEYGSPEGWQKKSDTVYAKYHRYVVHWYSNDGKTPPEEIKVKGAK